MRSLLPHREFRLLLYGQSASTVGDRIVFVALALYVTDIGLLLALPWPAAAACFALGLPVALLVIAYLVAGCGLMLFGIWWETALAERVPPQLLSRVTAYDWMGSLALLPIGYVLAGPLGEALGAVQVLAVGSVIAIAALAASLPVRQVWRLERA